MYDIITTEVIFLCKNMTITGHQTGEVEGRLEWWIDKKKQGELEKSFDTIFTIQARLSLWKENQALVSRIRGNFLANGWKFELAIDNALGIGGTTSWVNQWLHLTQSEKQELKKHILDLTWDSKVWPKEKHLRWETVKEKRDIAKTNFDELKGHQKIPEFDIVKRLVDEGYIAQGDLDALGWEKAPKDEKWIREWLSLLVSRRSWALDPKVRETILARLSGKEDKLKKEITKNAEYTEEDFNKSQFKADITKAIPGEKIELSPFTQFLAENHISIPKQNPTEWDKSNSVADIEATFSRSTKTIIEKQDDAFRASNKTDIDIVLTEKGNLKEKYSALKKLFEASNTEDAKKSQWQRHISEIGEKAQQLLRRAGERSKGLDEKHTKLKPILDILAKLEEPLDPNIDSKIKEQITQFIAKGEKIITKIEGGSEDPQEAVDFLRETQELIKKLPPPIKN